MTIVLYLIGRAGSGKYTIAQCLEKYSFKVADNHLVNNPIFALLDLDGVTPIPDAAWEAIAKIRTHVFDFIAQEPKHNYVLTNELLEDAGDHALFNQIQNMAERRQSLFVPVRLHLSKEENARRIQMPERALRFKSTQIDDRAYEKPLIQVSHPNLMDIDGDQLTAETVTQMIMERIEQLSSSSSVGS